MAPATQWFSDAFTRPCCTPGEDKTAYRDMTLRALESIKRGDCETGVELLGKASAAKYPDATLHLGELYDAGKCVPRDWARAARLFRRVAETRRGLEGILIGYMYLHGRGVPRDAERARDWFRRSVLSTTISGDAGRRVFAQLLLRHRRIPEELEKELDWIEEIEEGDAETLYAWAHRIRDGDGYPKNRQAAFYWLRDAARKGLAKAQYEVGLAYMDGEYGETNKSSGFWMLRTAGQAGFVPAQKEVGLRYERGDGVDRNRLSIILGAYFWLRLAQNNGADVGGVLDRAESRLTPIQKGIVHGWIDEWPDFRGP